MRRFSSYREGFIATVAAGLDAQLAAVRAAIPSSEGEVASYIPTLSSADASTFGAAVCSIQGDYHSVGDDRLPFSIQSCVKPFTYLMACDEIGMEATHEYVGREPSGRSYNAFALSDSGNLPFNPMINAGAIAVCDLIEQGLSAEDRFARVHETIRAAATDGGRAFDDGAHFGFDDSVYKSERATGFTNIALAHFLRSHHDVSKAMTPASTPRDVEENLDLYFKACSLTVDVRAAATLAATLASGGVSPFSGTRRFAQRHAASAVQLMFSCGMYEASGAWACKVGLPAKSGVAGCILIVVPNVLGIAVLAPPLDATGNSVRGAALIENIAEEFNLNVFSQLMLGNHDDIVGHLEEMHTLGSAFRPSSTARRVPTIHHHQREEEEEHQEEEEEGRGAQRRGGIVRRDSMLGTPWKL